MRFRLIEKDMGGMANVGLKDQHIQGKEDDVTTSDSKTYIGSKGKQKLAMNKIKNTKVGDDIHYYINGKEGRGIVVKMANEYMEVFKEDGQLGTIHINDTFFVKDILINKQWDDMDDVERYDALTKIHAPSPRYITKTWYDMPEEIKILLQKEGGNMAGGTGSTMEEGETKEEETKDHARTGFAQNTQYKQASILCELHKAADCPHCGKNIKDYNQKYPPYWVDPETGEEDKSEHHYRYMREINEKKTGKMALGHPDWYDKEKNPHWTTPNTKGNLPKHPLEGGFDVRSQEAELRKKRRILGAVNDENFHKRHEKYTKRRSEDEQKKIFEKESQAGTVHQPDEKKVEPKKVEPKKDEASKPSKPTGGFVTEEDYDNDDKKKAHYINKSTATDDNTTDSTNVVKAYEVWLERRQEWIAKNKPESYQDAKTKPGGMARSRSAEPQSRTGQATGEIDRDKPNKHATEVFQARKPQLPESYQQAKLREGGMARSRSAEPQSRSQQERETVRETMGNIQSADKSRAFRKLKPVYEGDTKEAEKSDVEHGHYGNVGREPNVAVSTDTNVDVTEGTGYEERPHISVEEAGKLPRSTFNESGSELTVTGSQDSKDEPKFSQPVSQEQPVRKAGIPQQHPNTYGMRYGMKGGVKKVWCPEHQMWEETRKDWHEE